MNNPKAFPLEQLRVACQQCSLRELCLPLGLDGNELRRLDQIVRPRRQLLRGEFLYHEGAPFQKLFAVRSGSIKTTGLTEDGRIQVLSFYFPGEILGIDAIQADRHACSAEALEATEVCEIPYQQLSDLARALPGLQRQLLRIMSGEVVRDQSLLLALGTLKAEERVATCLLSFSERQRRQGLPDDQLLLSMSRQDLGDYLGLALETVSRILSRFQDAGLLKVQGKRVSVLDMAGLRAAAASGCAN
ncbi:fumarate/nitrate reduction transcriptional regulator Fnr [Ectothiorhodospiraceae bacterium 2226]|nr:fumarate/nitrate reduction transcriptional regulator Fnr [Ectothiorhodospiraceae bacterium 2226]